MTEQLLGKTVELIPSSKRYRGGKAVIVEELLDTKTRRWIVRRVGDIQTFRVDRGEFRIGEELQK